MEFGLCMYASAVGCSTCDFVVYRLCPKFRKARFFACGASLGKFVYTTRIGGVSIPEVSGSVVYWHKVLKVSSFSQLYADRSYATAATLLKSMAVRVAMESYSARPVIYHTLDTCINSLFLYDKGEYEFERGVYFIEVFDILISDQKAQVMLNSFITKVLDLGSRVFVLSSWFVPMLGPSWVQLPYRGVVSSTDSVPSSGSGSSVIRSSADEGRSSKLIADEESYG